MTLKRVEGQEQPFIPLGMFRLRLPFIHYRITGPEILMGLIISFIYFIPVALYENLFGLPKEQSYALIHISLWLLLLHGHFGDYGIGGWITAALPLIVAHVSAYPQGTERLYALMSIQIWVGVITLVLGVTGLAKKLLEYLPQSLKAGILLGASVTGFWVVLSPLSKSKWMIEKAPYGIGLSALFLFLLWSYPLIAKSKKVVQIRKMMSMALPIGFLLGGVIGTIAGEIPLPDMKWGLVHADYSVMWKFSLLGVGFPSMSIFLAAFPLSILIYIIAYGDFVFVETVVSAGQTRRPDEKIDINASRAHIIVGVRNFIHTLIGPHPILAGPAFPAYTAIVIDRWQKGKEMDSLFGGLCTAVIFTIVGSYLDPIVSAVSNSLVIALALALLLQGFICAYVAMSMIKYVQQAGIAMCMAMVLATRGAAWGIGTGIVLYLLLEFRKKREDRFETIKPVLLTEKQETA